MQSLCDQFRLLQPASEKELTTSAGSGTTLLGSFTQYDPSSCSWRTSGDLFEEDSVPFLGLWPASGSIVNGAAFERQTLALHISGKGYSFSRNEWPTPTSAEKGSDAMMRGNPTLLGAAKTWMTPTARDYKGAKAGPKDIAADPWAFHPDLTATGHPSRSTSGPHSPAKRRLNWRFVAWMMGHWWLTETKQESRIDMLRLLGNSVVPLQAAVAFRELATRMSIR